MSQKERLLCIGIDPYNMSLTGEVTSTLGVNCGMSTGRTLVLIESNQNHATITDGKVCTTLPASMGEGGGYVPMIAYEKD